MTKNTDWYRNPTQLFGFLFTDVTKPTYYKFLFSFSRPNIFPFSQTKHASLFPDLFAKHISPFHTKDFSLFPHQTYFPFFRPFYLYILFKNKTYFYLFNFFILFINSNMFPWCGKSSNNILRSFKYQFLRPPFPTLACFMPLVLFSLFWPHIGMFYASYI